MSFHSAWAGGSWLRARLGGGLSTFPLLPPWRHQLSWAVASGIIAPDRQWVPSPAALRDSSPRHPSPIWWRNADRVGSRSHRRVLSSRPDVRSRSAGRCAVWRPVQAGVPPPGRDWRGRDKDAGSVRSGATDATEDEVSHCLARSWWPGLRPERVARPRDSSPRHTPPRRWHNAVRVASRRRHRILSSLPGPSVRVCRLRHRTGRELGP